jgi:hypothetical protein
MVLSQRIGADEVRRVMLGWPDEHCIEIRQCHCGQPIAARRTTGASQ